MTKDDVTLAVASRLNESLVSAVERVEVYESDIRNDQQKIELRSVLDRAAGQLAMVRQWRDDNTRPSSLAFAVAYANKAEALVEHVEIRLFKSSGGFGPGQKESERHTLEQRLDYLRRHLH